jgi:hypothetical protein
MDTGKEHYATFQRTHGKVKGMQWAKTNLLGTWKNVFKTKLVCNSFE